MYNGLDIIDFFRIDTREDGVRFRRHSWRKLDSLLRQLRMSDASALIDAQAQDPEHAEWLLSQPEKPAPPPPVSDFTPTHAILVEVRDQLAELIAVSVASVPGNKYRRPVASRRPSTALSRARYAASKARHNSLVDEVKAAQERWVANAAKSGT